MAFNFTLECVNLISFRFMSLPRFRTVYRCSMVAVPIVIVTAIVVMLGGQTTSRPEAVSEIRFNSSFPHPSNSNESIVNPHPFRYLLNPETFCLGKDVFIIAYVLSSPQHFIHRQVIRNTWGNGKEYFKEKILVVFILGQVPDTEVMRSVRKESDRYGDIVQENFDDTYRNLTYTTIAGLKWVSTFCKQARYVLKTDDDMFVNVYVLVDQLRSTLEPSQRRRNLILCFQWIHMKVIRDKKSKFYISEDEFPWDYFAPYCSGSAYLMSSDVTGRLYRASLTTRYFWFEDYYVTGMLVRKLDLDHVRYNNAYVLNPAKVLDQFENRKHQYAFFHVHNHEIMFYLATGVILSEKNLSFSNEIV